MSTRPPVTSYSRGTSAVSVVLPEPTAADQRHRLAGPDLEVDAAEHVDVGVGVAEAHVLEAPAWCPARPATGATGSTIVGSVSSTSKMRRQALAASSARASSQPSEMIGQISRRYSVRNATSSPTLIAPCAAAYTPPHGDASASTTCG